MLAKRIIPCLDVRNGKVVKGVNFEGVKDPLVSTVVMTITPAVAAGVKEIILCTPPRVHPEDKAAAEKAGTGIPGKPFVGALPTMISSSFARVIAVYRTLLVSRYGEPPHAVRITARYSLP